MKLPALLTTVALLLAACGGGGTADTTASTQTPAATAAAPTTAAATQTIAPATSTATTSLATATASDATASAPSSTAPSATGSTDSTLTSSTSTSSSTSTPAGATSSGSASTASKPPTLVEYYGDSIVWGWLPNNDWVRVPDPEPSVFAADNKLNVANMGSPGRLAENALAGDSVYPAWTTQMAKSQASHVIIEYHSHDTVADTTTRVRQLIQIAKAAGKKVIVETIGPGYHGGNLSYQQISQAQRAAATAENVPVIDQTSYLEQYLANTGKTIWDICGDGLHPNPDIYVMKGHYAAAQFASMK